MSPVFTWDAWVEGDGTCVAVWKDGQPVADEFLPDVMDVEKPSVRYMAERLIRQEKEALGL